MTYSIVARDNASGQLGVGAQSHFFGVGRLAGWLEPGVGAVATQAFVNINFGPRSLEGLRLGGGSDEVLGDLIESDEMRQYRQLAIVKADGTCAAYTGDRCVAGAGHRIGDGVVVLGNMLASPKVVDAMMLAYNETRGVLADRILAALTAAEATGGDARGSQSAFLRVVSGSRSCHPWREVVADLRVDDHVDPVGELARLLPRLRAFEAVGSVMFAQGIMLGEFHASESEVERALEQLDGAAEVLRDNHEAAFWRAVLLARAGRADDARSAFADLFAVAGHLRPFARSVGTAGVFDDVEVYL